MPDDTYLCEVKVTGIVFASSKDDAREKIRKVLRAPCADDCVMLEHEEPTIRLAEDDERDRSRRRPTS